MNIASILELGDTQKIIDIITKINEIDFEPQKLQDIYDGKHAILERLDKVKIDAEGNPTDFTETAKMVLNYQKKIVESAVAFLFGKPVSVSKRSEGGDEAFKFLIDALDSMKWHSSNKQLARTDFTQRQAAKMFFIKNPDEKENRKVSLMNLSVSNGTFYPNFADNGDLDAFLRLYEKDVLVGGEIEKQENFELYTAENILTGFLENDNWVVTSIANIFGKIPVVFYNQNKAEWEDVTNLIARQELSISELIDTNQYFAAPIAKMYGKVTGMAEKGEQGKLLQCEITTDAQGNQVKSDVEYLTWNQRPESLKLQLDLVEKYIFSFTNTADISFNSMLENKPGNISGSALQFLMLDPILKSYNKQEIFEANLQRELSVIMSILGQIETKYQNDFAEMKFDIIFNSVLPNNLAEIIDTLSTATGNEAIMSQSTAVQRNPLVIDKELEMKKINEQSGIEAGTLNL